MLADQRNGDFPLKWTVPGRAPDDTPELKETAANSGAQEVGIDTTFLGGFIALFIKSIQIREYTLSGVIQG